MASLTRRSILLVAGLGLVLTAATAEAERPFRLPRPVPRFSITLEDARGSALPTYRHDGRTFVLGERGERYAVRITNSSSERVEAVVSVDGRDAVSGRAGDYHTQRGYIVPPYGSVRIEGFRRSLDEVASFRFSDPEDSYSSRLGTPENVGVIGVAVFSEKRRPSPRPAPRLTLPEAPRAADDRDAASAERSAPAPKRGGAPRSRRSAGRDAAPAPERERAPRGSVDNLGTEYGESRESSVVEVPFQRRSSEPDRVLSVRYDDEEGLIARGIDVRPRRHFRPDPVSEPEPFPDSRFAAPPPR